MYPGGYPAEKHVWVDTDHSTSKTPCSVTSSARFSPYRIYKSALCNIGTCFYFKFCKAKAIETLCKCFFCRLLPTIGLALA